MLQKMTSVFIIVCAIVALSMFNFNEIATAEGSVGLDVVIVGLAEFTPETTSKLDISVQNNNIIDKIETMAIQSGVSHYYGSAVSLTALLEKGDAPISIKTEKLLLGTLVVGQATPPVPFIIEVNENARPGKYQVTVVLTYRTLVLTSEKEEGKKGADLDWSDRTETKELEIEIKEDPLEFKIISTEAMLQPGVRTDINIMFKNNGSKIAYDSEVKLRAYSPISLTDDSAFLGTIEPGAMPTGTFGIKITGDAIPKEYALDAIIKYKDDKDSEYVSKELKVPIVVYPSSSVIQEMSRHIVGIAIGAGLVVVIWFIWYLFAKLRGKKTDST